MKAYRFMYRHPGESGWRVCLGLTDRHTPEDAARIVAMWTRRDMPAWEWACEPAMRTDIDYPGNREKRLRRLARTRKAKQRRAQAEWEALVASGLA